MMKRLLCLLLLLLFAMPAMAAGKNCTVTCVGCTVDGQKTASVSAGQTVIAVADDFDSIVGWKLNGAVCEGETFYYISFTVSADTVVEAIVSAEGRPAELDEEQVAAQDAQAQEGRYVIRAINAELQYLDGNHKGAGNKLTEIDFTDSYKNPVTRKNSKGGVVSFQVTAKRPYPDAKDQTPHGSEIDYWVINGVRYNFWPGEMPTNIRFLNVTESMTIEVVYPGHASQTQFTTQQLRQMRTGEKLVVTAKNARMNKIELRFTDIGDSFTTLDFTDGYVTYDSKNIKHTYAGWCDVKVTANVESQMLQRAEYWKFNNVSVYFENYPTCFSVMGLNRSMTYTAHIKKTYVTINYN